MGGIFPNRHPPDKPENDDEKRTSVSPRLYPNAHGEEWMGEKGEGMISAMLAAGVTRGGRRSGFVKGMPG